MYPDELKSLTENYEDRKYLISLSLNKEKKQQIIDATNWYYSAAPIKFRCYLIQNGITEKDAPKCPTCDSLASFNKVSSDRFISFCSDACSKAFGHLSPEVKERLEDYDWLYNKRVNQRMSYGAIAELLNVSTAPIKKYCKLHKIPEFKLNESIHSIKEKLEDKEWLYEQHVINRKKTEDIAYELGSSKATVSLWLAKHDIEANKVNSYARKINRASKEEQEVVQFIRSLGIDPELNNRSILNGLELDIVCHSERVAIEYNGVFSHLYRPEEKKDARRKDKNYHLNKTELVEKLGYQLIHIFSDDWLYNKEVVKSLIAAKLNKSGETIYARRCDIRELTKHEKSTFLNQTHMQANDKSTYSYGLIHSGEIVACMTFCKSRYNKKYDYELSRFSCKRYARVVGGFSKLLKHFRKSHAGSIVSYADRSISMGQVYSANGFELVKVNPPNYHYVAKNSIKRLHRAAFMKSRIAPRDERSEWEIMRSRGYSKIYNSGTLTYVLNS